MRSEPTTKQRAPPGNGRMVAGGARCSTHPTATTSRLARTGTIIWSGRLRQVPGNRLGGAMEASEAFCLYGLQPGAVQHGAGLLKSPRVAGRHPHRPGGGPGTSHDALRLEDHFELHEFPNDLARWCWTESGRPRPGRAAQPGRSLPAAVVGGVAGRAGQHDRGPLVDAGPRALVPAGTGDCT